MKSVGIIVVQSGKLQMMVSKVAAGVLFVVIPEMDE
jgi:hypothetical protein